MPLSDESKRSILDGILEIVSDVSDIEYQKKFWILGSGAEHYAFDDTCCDFFLECDEILDKYKDFGIMESQYQPLKQFRDRFRIFSDENNFPEEFIHTSEWKKITWMAKEVLKAFNYQKPPR